MSMQQIFNDIGKQITLLIHTTERHDAEIAKLSQEIAKLKENLADSEEHLQDRIDRIEKRRDSEGLRQGSIRS